MRLVSLRAGSVFVVAGALSLGCGLRSDAFFTAETDAADDDGLPSSGFSTDDPSSGGADTALPPPEEGRMGSCTNAIALPTTDARVEGVLDGPGLYTGICGDTDGLEDVYVLRPTAAADVTITFDAATEFTPTVRVQENGCLSNEGVLRTCTDDWFDGGAPDPRHFLVFGNREYFIHVDSNQGDGGDYAFDVSFAPPPVTECNVHPNVIFQDPGSLFRWENAMPGGQGDVDSQCGGLGRENFFQLEMFQAGPVNVSVFGTAGFRPVVSVRTDCSARTEVDCSSELLGGTPGVATLDVFLEAGTYFIDVDDLDLEAGDYLLEVAF